MKLDLSEKQQEIFSFIIQELESKGYPPSVREICVAVNLKSTSTVHSHLNKLEEKGYIKRDSSKTRAIEIISSTNYNSDILKDDSVKIPVIGKVTAGEPILAIENIEDYISFSKKFVNNKVDFILKVKGESMIDAGILNDDYILIKKQTTAENGEIVVALVDGISATVKRFFKENNIFRLQPENSSMEPIYSKNIDIIGIVKGVYRML